MLPCVPGEWVNIGHIPDGVAKLLDELLEEGKIRRIDGKIRRIDGKITGELTVR